MRALGSAPRASRASTSGSRSRSASRPAPRARAAVLAVPRLQPRADGAGGGVQRRDAVDRPVRIGAPLQQKVGECDLPDDDRVGQRMRSVRTGLVHAGSRGEQQLGRLDVAVAGGGDQRRERLPRSGMHVGAPARRARGRRRGGRPATAHISAVSWVAAVAASTSAPPESSARTTSRLPVRARRSSAASGPFAWGRVRIRPGGEESLDHRHARVLARPGERRHAVIVRRHSRRRRRRGADRPPRRRPSGPPRAAPSRHRPAPRSRRDPRRRAARAGGRCRAPPSPPRGADPARRPPRCPPLPRGGRGTGWRDSSSGSAFGRS